MTQKSKHWGKRTCLYDENPDRRVICPEWNFTQGFKERLSNNAKENGVSQSKYFETVVQNFFLLEDPNIMIIGKQNSNICDKNTRRLRMTLHPIILNSIKEYSKKTNTSSSRYLSMLFSIYEAKYGNEMELKNLIMHM